MLIPQKAIVALAPVVIVVAIASAILEFFISIGWPLIVLGVVIIAGGCLIARAMWKDYEAWAKRTTENGAGDLTLSVPPRPTPPLTEEEIDRMDPVNQRFIRAWRHQSQSQPSSSDPN